MGPNAPGQPEQLRQYRMLFESVPEGEVAVDPNELGRRSKLGGSPDWDQDEEWPDCPTCHERMIFVGQIDSIEYDWPTNPHRVDAIHGNPHFMFGDVGMIFIFFCWACLESQNVIQSG